MSPSNVKRWLLCLLGSVLPILVLGGCSSYDGIAQVRQDIIAAGFDDAGVYVRHIQGVKLSEDRVEVALLGSSMDHDAAWEAAATEVWERLPVEFDTLLVEYQGEVKVTSYADLEGRFGARPDGLVEQEIVSVLAGRVSGAVVIVGALGVVALVPILVLVRRHRRRRRAEQDRSHRSG